jgi:hypothetical protein
VRSMQYESFYEDGDSAVADLSDYTSENTDRLDVEDTKKLLLTLPEFEDISSTELDDAMGIGLEPFATSMKVNT